LQDKKGTNYLNVNNLIGYLGVCFDFFLIFKNEKRIEIRFCRFYGWEKEN